MMTSMNFPTLPYDHVIDSFLQELWFWGPTYPSEAMSLFLLFFLSLPLDLFNVDYK